MSPRPDVSAERKPQILQAALRLYNEMYHLVARGPHVRQVLSTYNLRYQQALTALIQQGIERGELRPTDPKVAAFAFQSVFDGLMQNLLLSPSNFDLSIVLRQVFDMLFDGLKIPDEFK